MITGDYDFLKNIAKFNVCAQHHTPLEIAWHSQEKTWVLRCDEGTHKKTAYAGKEGVEIPDMPHPGHYPDAVTRMFSLTEGYKAGAEVPEPIKSNVIKGMRRRAMQENKGKKTTELSMVPQTDLGTGELLLPELITALVDYAHKYKLDPERGHVVLMYSKPYITIDGYLYHAGKSGKPYTLESRPMTTDEKDNYMLGATDHGWLAKVIFTQTGETFRGIGVVTYTEMSEPSKRAPNIPAHPVVAAHPWQLGQKRAEWQALRRAFPIGESEE